MMLDSFAQEKINHPSLLDESKNQDSPKTSSFLAENVQQVVAFSYPDGIWTTSGVDEKSLFPARFFTGAAIDDDSFNLTLPDLLMRDDDISAANDSSANGDHGPGGPGGPGGLGGRDPDLARAEVAVQAVIFVLALLSNALVIVALLRQLRRKPSSRMYRLMFHLSVADLLVAVLNVLPQLIWDITYRFRGPDLLCRAVKFGQVFPLYLSSFLLTLMAVDRVGVTRRHGRPRRAGRMGRLGDNGGPRALVPFILLAWALAFLLALPQTIIFSMTAVDEEGTFDCWAEFAGNKALEKTYVILFLVVVFFLPFLVISASYLIVTLRVWRYSRSIAMSAAAAAANRNSSSNGNGSAYVAVSSSKSLGDDDDDAATADTGLYEMRVFKPPAQPPHQPRRPPQPLPPLPSRRRSACAPHGGSRPLRSSCHQHQTQHPQHLVLLSKAKRKSLALTATVSVCFAVCWLPWSVTMLLLAFQEGGEDLHPVLVILALLASLNSTTNPWIYLCFSSAVLQQVKQLVGLRSTLGGPDSVGGADADRLQQQSAADDPQLLQLHHQHHGRRVLFRRRDVNGAEGAEGAEGLKNALQE